jgi:hypothetical protein
MRFSIVFDDNGTILAASIHGEEPDGPMPGPNVRQGHFEISDDLPDAELQQTVERVLIDMDTRKLTHLPAQKETEDGPLLS